MEHALSHFFSWFGMPSIGLPAVFISAFVSATLLPVGSEPILFGYTALNPDLYWVAILVAAVGNTLGGMFDWWLGLIARRSMKSVGEPKNERLKDWLEAWGPKFCYFLGCLGLVTPYVLLLVG